MATRPYVKFSQFNGIVCYGELLNTVMRDGIETALIRYWYDPSGDPPRRPYTLIEVDRLEWLLSLPKQFVKAGSSGLPE